MRGEGRVFFKAGGDVSGRGATDIRGETGGIKKNGWGGGELRVKRSSTGIRRLQEDRSRRVFPKK